MERLWAPWRGDYIREAKSEECIFCSKPALDDDVASYILWRGEHCYVMLNAFPYNNGHLMVSPYAHVESIEALDDGALLELNALAARSQRALRDCYSPEGFNLGANQGTAAGAGFGAHLHLHVVPRWSGDTNFMPVLASARVLPQLLEDSYAEVRAAFLALED